MTGMEMVVADGREVEVSHVERQVAEAKAAADLIEVRNQDEATVATEFLALIAKQKRDHEAERKGIVGPINASVKAINAKYKDAVAPLEAADLIVRGKVKAFTDEQARIAAEEEARLEAERQRREAAAAAARAMQEAEAEAYEMDAEREARKLAEEARKQADDEAAAKAAEDAAAKLAEAKTAVAAVKALPTLEIPRAHVEAPAPLKSASGGVATRKVWKVTATNKAEMPVDLLVEDMPEINRRMRDGVRANGKPPEIPGVTFEQVSELAVRAS